MYKILILKSILALPQNTGKFRKRNCVERANAVSNPISFDKKCYRLALIVYMDWLWFSFMVLVMFERFQKLIQQGIYVTFWWKLATQTKYAQRICHLSQFLTQESIIPSNISSLSQKVVQNLISWKWNTRIVWIVLMMMMILLCCIQRLPLLLNLLTPSTVHQKRGFSYLKNNSLSKKVQHDKPIM